MASSSSSSFTTCEKHEVFISFRGSDVRVGFLSHLLKALVEDNVDTFVDEELGRGEKISSSLLEIIEGSYISIVIFSENYAFSEWCLAELVKIVECKKTNGQIVIPVFYGVDPTHVQELSGSFGHAISMHREAIKDDSYKVENWCKALRETGALSGFDSCNYKSDSKLIEEIIRHVLEKLNHLFSSDCYYDDGLVGIDSRVKNVKSLLNREDVRVVGIWGTGGIGKTTIAQKVFDLISGQFQRQCFVANVREKFENRPDILQNELLSKLLGAKIFDIGNSMIISSLIKRRLLRKKILIVLDDVSDFDQLKSITGKRDDYGSGSRIIVTSRDKQVLKNVDAEIYEVEKLNESEALRLFCLRAFKQNTPKKGFRKLSKRVVEYAQGLPLALEVLGCNLQSKSMEEWKDELEYLKSTSDQKIHKILRRSYDGLSKDEKAIFMDIACFFRLEHRDYVESILNIPGSKIGISSLIDKSLVSISSGNCLLMHDLIQQMAKEIISEEKMLKKRCWLWNHEEIYYLLIKEKGSEAIKGISLDMSKIKDISLSPKAFEKMQNLRYLIFYESFSTSDFEVDHPKAFERIFSLRDYMFGNSYCSADIRVFLPEGLEFLSKELRYLFWYQYPSKSLPLSFCAEKLVELRMYYSHLEELWNGVQNLANLKCIDLRQSKKLTKIPDLSRALKLEFLCLSGCTSLVEIPSSLKYLCKLTKIYLDGCFSLCRLPSCLHLQNLKFLSLSRCSKVTMFPFFPCHARHPRNAIAKVPSSIGYSFQLCDLYLDECSRLESLPDNICNLIYLRRLHIEGCANLCELPEGLGNLKFLEQLIANRSGIKQLPNSLCNLKNLEGINVSNCGNLRGLPQNLGNLESLRELIANRSGIKEVPSSINNLGELRILDVEGCEGLILPPMTGDLPNLRDVNLNCCGISEFPNSLCSITSLKRLFLRGNNFESIPESIKQLSMLRVLHLSDCKRLKHLPDLPSLLFLHASNCTSLESASGLWNNEFSDFHNCINLDKDKCSKTMDHLLTKPDSLVKAQSVGKRFWLCSPGTEVPQKMTYQNKSGSSLSFSFKLLEQTDFLWFYLCAVLDPQVSESFDGEVNIRCIAQFIDESGGCTGCEESKFWYNGMLVQSNHVLLQLDYFNNCFVKGNKYTIDFNFYAREIRHPLKGRRSYDAIIKCGVHPVFDHELIWSMENEERKRRKGKGGENGHNGNGKKKRRI